MHEANPEGTHFPVPVPLTPSSTHLSAHAWWVINPLRQQGLTTQSDTGYRFRRGGLLPEP